MAASDMAKGSATSVTAISSSSNIARMARRVGSDRAAKIRSSGWVMAGNLAFGPPIVNQMVEYRMARQWGDPPVPVKTGVNFYRYISMD